MRERIAKIMNNDLRVVDTKTVRQVSDADAVIWGINQAAEEIEKMYNDMNCGNCKHYCFSEEHQHLFCLKHDCLLFNAHILKCNQWEAKQ